MSEPRGTVLVVDDDASVGKVLTALLAQAGIAASHVSSAQAALEALEGRPVDVVVTDLRMPGMDGMELLREVRRRFADVPVVMLTAHGTVPLAVEAMKAGAADFLLEPFDRDEVLFTVRKALAAANAESGPPAPPPTGRLLLGESPAMRALVDLLERAAKSNVTVLLRGESGTGKELAARTIHDASARRDGPFVPVHGAALPENLLESELFGYEKGAFTGATSRKPGRVELAEGGTLFFDEIAEVSPAVQAKLLRLLQEREFQRLGGTRAENADVRFVAATHRDLEAMVEAGQFREDLFYRLNVLPVHLPPLRERAADIPLLARHFCEAFTAEHGRAIRIEEGALSLLAKQPWPGNVRQLSNLVERLVILADGPTIGAAQVSRQLERDPGRATAPPAVRESGPDLESRVRETERAAIEEALAHAGGNRTLAARILGISRRTLYTKLADLGLV